MAITSVIKMNIIQIKLAISSATDGSSGQTSTTYYMAITSASIDNQGYQ